MSSDPRPIVRPANVLVLSKDPDDPNNKPVYDALGPSSPLGKITATCATVEDVKGLDPSVLSSVSVLFLAWADADLVAAALSACPSVKWAHSRSAGVEGMVSPTLTSHPCRMTNAKGCFSRTLAEYCMSACGYFAKDFKRLEAQKAEKRWDQYAVKEMSTQTMGVVGYGDIGRACGALAKAYGMRVLALRRDPSLCDGDPVVDAAYGSDGVGEMLAESDYVLVAAPLTA
eukprot:CAMPEP_0182469880 /NCGR_PEP_ID=MMETSP1319-20130603/17781_1 /TAXON_ID=172717 /ORGANISM="Bolidomonas pacifica, Strain RCC208" /LENGTH=228 /DNA_ID=CAMNT_0024670243 /DNA_START=154 /DNA_END=836 /DNA_ORIENTATION=-